jgi:hypothetical protein
MTRDATGRESGEPSKAKVFISYSRKDMAFADRLEVALKARGFEPLIDRSEIFGRQRCLQGPSVTERPVALPPYQGRGEMIRYLSENPEYFEPETLDVMIRALDEAWERFQGSGVRLDGQAGAARRPGVCLGKQPASRNESISSGIAHGSRRIRCGRA